MSSTLLAQEAKVTPLMSKDLTSVRQRRSDDHRGISAGQFGPDHRHNALWVYLCAGRLDRDAGAEAEKK